MFEYGKAPRLHDCRAARAGRREGAELFIVEGESALQAVLGARDAEHQAVIAMQGKPLNPLRAKRHKILDNGLYRPVIEAIGAGFDQDVVPRRARYERIVLLFDPDADGIHASALMLMFFDAWLRALLEAGLVVAVRAPFATVEHERLAAPMHAYSKEDLHHLLAQLEQHGARDPQRRYYRGLASIDGDVLAESCLVPATRRGTVLGPADAEQARQVFG